VTLWGVRRHEVHERHERADDYAASAVTVRWSKYRGPGALTFDKARPDVEKVSADETAAFSGKATTSVKFAEPANYLLHLTANDYSGDGGGGFGCCCSSGPPQVSVKQKTARRLLSIPPEERMLMVSVHNDSLSRTAASAAAARGPSPSSPATPPAAW